MALDGAFGQRELVGGRGGRFLVFDTGLHRATRGALGGCHLGGGCSGRQLASEGVEIAALRGEDLARFTGRGGLCGGFIGYLQHGTGLHPVDVALDEGVGIGAHQRHQHLVERHSGWAVGVGDATGRVTGLHGDAIGRGGAWLGGRCAARRAGNCRSCRRARRGGGGSRLGRRSGCGNLGRGRYCGSRAAQRWRIEQHGVAAHDVAAAPRGVKNEVHKGVVDGAIAGKAQHSRAIGAALQLHPQVVHRRVEFHALGPKDVRRSGGGAQGLGFGRRDLGQVDFGAQRLSECRLHRNATQCEGGGIVGIQAGQCDGRGRQDRKFPTMHVCHQLWCLSRSVEWRCSSHGHSRPGACKYVKSTIASMFCTDKLRYGRSFVRGGGTRFWGVSLLSIANVT